MIGEGELRPQSENHPQKVIQEISMFIEGKGVGTTEFTAFSDLVDSFASEIAREGALKYLVQKTLRERVSDRDDLIRAESHLRQCELRTALIDERMASRDAREPGYASAAIEAHSLRKKVVEAYQRTQLPNEAKVNALKDLSAIQSQRTYATSVK
jgi:hypothetical protein